MEKKVAKEIKCTLPDLSELEINNVIEVLRSGWITTGPKVKLLEKKIAKFIANEEINDTPRCVCLGSATAALETALRLLGIGSQNGGSQDDEVITCAYTYTASASVICHVGAKMVLVDCSNNDGSIEMDYDKLEAAINKNTKAIIPVDIAGVPCDNDKILEIVIKKKNLFNPSSKLQNAIGRVAIIDDAAHAFGATYKGKHIGDVSDFTAFSFHATKNFTTGEGGALLWKCIENIEDSEIYKQIQLYSLHGQSKDAFAKDQLGSWEYDVIGPWYKCNMTDIMAAIGLGQLERYPNMLTRRQEIINKYDKAFKPLGIIPLDHYTNDRCSSGHLYITRVPGIDRNTANKIIEEMAEYSISTNVHFKPLPMLTAYKNLEFDIKDYPNAYAKFENEITLPLHTKLSDEEIDFIIEKYIEIVKKYTR